MPQSNDAFVKHRVSADPGGDTDYSVGTLASPKITPEGIGFVQLTNPGGDFFANLVANDQEEVAPITDPELLPVVSYGMLYDPDRNAFFRVQMIVVDDGIAITNNDGTQRVCGPVMLKSDDSGLYYPARMLLSDADAQDPVDQVGLSGVVARLQGFDGATFDRLRTASATNIAAQSGLGAQISAPPGEWSINHTPAANTQATITRAAGAAGVRHVCKSITATLIGLAAAVEATVLVNLRDGATGAGTILWSTRLLVQGGTGAETGISLSGLNIVGSAATAMTLEFAAAGGANTFESVAMTGYDVS